MAEECCVSGGNIMILSCSGGSNVGQLANQAAVELTQEGFGKIYCLAGIGGRLAGFVQSAKEVDQLIVIDGCEIGCGKATLESAGVPLRSYLVVTEIGVEKNKNFKLEREEVEKVKETVKNVLKESSFSPGAPNMASGGSCCA